MGLFCLSVHFTAKYWSEAHFYITVTAFTSDQRYIILLLKQEWWWATLWKGEPAERKGSGFASSSQGEMYVFTYPENRKLHFPSLAMPHCVFIFAYTREKWEGISLHADSNGKVGFAGVSVPSLCHSGSWGELSELPCQGTAPGLAWLQPPGPPAPKAGPQLLQKWCCQAATHTGEPSNCKSSWSTKRAVMSLL